MSVAVNMPDGSVELVDPETLMWMREALPQEWKGAVAMKFSDGTIYSLESLGDLVMKFRAGGIRIAEFKPPATTNHIMVNPSKVIDIEPGNAKIFHPKAKSLLKFSLKTRIAVRETVDQATEILKSAT